MRVQVEEVFHAIADLSVEARLRYFAENDIDERTRSEVEELAEFDSDSDFSAALLRDIGQVAQGALALVEPQNLPCGPYHLGRLLGRGGMGAVYSAERLDGDVRQQVAVKLLRPGTDNHQLRQRFLAERQILATLSHPNIAKLLDAGHRQDGQPYLVMEYVDGKPIDVYAAGLSIRSKVTLFLKVCTAVSYLHRNLVVHRDLKPANILITSEGEPKLLDFGIAKILDLTSDGTVTNVRMLTPQYASPEQVGDGRITTATDTYSLGAVLYELLTGKSPHQFENDSPAAIALAISRGRIIPPSRFAPDLRGDLEAVLMKALRKEPHERYTSVDAFADDLGACLEWRLVRARSSDIWYRTRKFLRRHWVAATATALVIASLSTGLFFANREREIAERRFGQLRRLSNRVIDLERTIRTLPGSIEARQQLVAASIEYLEGLSRDVHGGLDLAQEISDGYWRMARIQGVNTEFNLGDSVKAEESLKKADALMERLLASRPQDRDALFRSAVIAHDRMILADTEDRGADVLTHSHKAVERIEDFLRRDDPSHPVCLEGFLRPGDSRQSERIGAATLYVNIARTHVNLHLYAQAAAYARRGVELSGQIPTARDVTSGALSVLANALRYQGDLEAALATIRQARKLSERADYPSQSARVFSLFGVMLREGRVLGEDDAVNLGRPADAVEILQKALDLTEAAARNDPSDSGSRAHVGTAARELGDILRDRDPRRALAVYDLGILRLAEMHNSLKARRDRAQLLANSSYPLRRLHRVSEATTRIHAAVAILQATKDYPADRISLGSYDYEIVCALADHEADTADPRRAIAIYEDLLGRIRASQPQPEGILADAIRLSHVYTTLARLDRRVGRNDAASALESQSLHLWRIWEAKLPNNSFVLRQLAGAKAPIERSSHFLR
jgi:serine/threonine protein kinase/tetratricopeptide (TPR) repeat protein